MNEREKVLRLELDFCRQKFENISSGGVDGLKIAPRDIVEMAAKEAEDIDFTLKLVDRIKIEPQVKRYRYALEQIQNEAGQGASPKFLSRIAYDVIRDES